MGVCFFIVELRCNFLLRCFGVIFLFLLSLFLLLTLRFRSRRRMVCPLKSRYSFVWVVCCMILNLFLFLGMRVSLTCALPLMVERRGGRKRFILSLRRSHTSTRRSSLPSSSTTVWISLPARFPVPARSVPMRIVV